MKICAVCDGPLTGAQKKLCSTRCKKRAKRNSEAKPEAKAKKRAREESSKVARMCAWCGNAWRVNARRASRYCSSRCSRAAQLPPPACVIPPGHPAIPPPPMALPPAPSGRRPKPKAPGIEPDPRHFTAAKCRWCCTHFVSVGRYKQSFCSKACHRSYWKALRRAQATEVGWEPISRASVFERDGWLCHLCGGPVNRKARPPYDPMAPTLDHVIPLSKGGPHAMANLRTAHFICNSRKGNRGTSEQLMLIGRPQGVGVSPSLAP